jgi:TolA-binding protein
VEKYPNDEAAPEAALLRGQILERDQKPQPALEAYTLLIDRYPASTAMPQALAAAAHLQEQAKNFQQADQLYARLLKDYPQLADRDTILYNRAWVLRELNRTADADQQFEELRTKYPKSRYWPDAVYRLAENAVQKPDYPRAKQLLTDLLEFGPGEQMLMHALYLSAQVAIAQEQWADALPPLARLVRDFPTSPLRLLADFWTAEANYRLGNYTEAGTQFTALAPKIPEKHEAWMAMVPLRQAQVLVHQKEWEDAEKLATPIAADYPDFEQQYEVDYVLGRCLAAKGKFSEAREAYGRVIRSQLGGKTETAAMAQWMIGESYFHQKNYEAAIREYLRLEILYAFPTWQGGALLQAAKCHEALGEWPQAVELYARLLKNYPQTTFAEEATRRLQSAQKHVQLK